jgi:hypothetical protein
MAEIINGKPLSKIDPNKLYKIDFLSILYSNPTAVNHKIDKTKCQIKLRLIISSQIIKSKGESMS